MSLESVVVRLWWFFCFALFRIIFFANKKGAFPIKTLFRNSMYVPLFK